MRKGTWSASGVLGLALLALLSGLANASPLTLRIDGSLYDATGVPVAGSADFQIRAYDASESGTLLWTSGVLSSALAEGGRFSLYMDATGGSPSLVSRLSDIASGDAIYFEITYDTTAGAANGSMDAGVVMPQRIRAKGSFLAATAGTADRIRRTAVSASAPTPGAILGYDGTQWGPMGVSVLVNSAYVGRTADTMSGILQLPSLTLGGVSAGAVLQLDAGRNLAPAAVSLADLNRLSGLTGNVQTQLNAKLVSGDGVLLAGDTMSGSLTLPSVRVTGLGTDAALIAGSSRDLATAGVSTATLNFLSGLTASVQTQLNGKQSQFTGQTASVVYAGPTGGSGAPGFRALAGSDLPAMVGDSGTGGVTGRAPAPAAGDAANEKFLRADGTWASFNYRGQTCSAGYYLTGFDSTGTKMCTALPSYVTYTRVGTSYALECGLRSDGGVQCWGVNSYGQLGNGSTTSSNVPVDVRNVDGTLLTDATALSVSYGTPCVIRTGGTVWCWGYNAHGNTGNGNTTNPQLAPVQAINVVSATQIAGGYYSNCARISNGTVKCWGYNGSYQLGDGTTNNASTPVQVIGITSAVHVAVGTYSGCAVLADGTVRCWGTNTYGVVGDGTTTTRPTPVQVIGQNGVGYLTGVTSVTSERGHSSYGEHACAVKSSGSVFCWGYNGTGQLGNGSTTTSYTPVPAVGISNATKVVVGLNHTCALLSDGGVKCWGGNSMGQLGTGDTSTYYAPVPVYDSTGLAYLTGATDISASDGASGGAYSSAAVVNGRIFSWGNNDNGTYGNNSTTGGSLPKGNFGP